ncbi:class I SAM-dependent methyltransferase [Isosphaeraceae bacterium EP7]
MSGIDEIPPSWRMPEGVDASLWTYARSVRLAAEEDSYFDGHPLFRVDRQFLLDRLTEPGRLVDLGCGAGRLTLEFARRGFDAVAVDLSRPMLRQVGAKGASEGLDVPRVEANLCHLPFGADEFDSALLMFSTLGMVRNEQARDRVLEEAARVLRPGGRLFLHAHNLWLNLHDPQGRAWLIGRGFRSLARKAGRGDRTMTYRGIAGMTVHLFTWGELSSAIGRAGLVIEEALPINEITAEPIKRPGFFPSIRAGGWLVVARKPGA